LAWPVVGGCGSEIFAGWGILFPRGREPVAGGGGGGTPPGKLLDGGFVATFSGDNGSECRKGLSKTDFWEVWLGLGSRGLVEILLENDRDFIEKLPFGDFRRVFHWAFSEGKGRKEGGKGEGVRFGEFHSIRLKTESCFGWGGRAEVG